jgi:hypothetical protein
MGTYRLVRSEDPYFLENRLKDGGYAPAAFYPQKDLLVLISVRG